MKALIKKYPDNCRKKSQEEVMLEPFPECVQADINDYLDNYHYALCENVPNNPVELYDIDQRMNVNNYRIESYSYKPSEDEEAITRYRAIWIWN